MIQIDAHSDTWEEKEKRIDRGKVFYHAIEEGLMDVSHSFQVGIRTINSTTHGCEKRDANWVYINGVPATIEEIVKTVGSSKAYLTFDIDVLDPAFARAQAHQCVEN